LQLTVSQSVSQLIRLGIAQKKAVTIVQNKAERAIYYHFPSLRKRTEAGDSTFVDIKGLKMLIPNYLGY
jgi:hypothetical protein